MLHGELRTFTQAGRPIGVIVPARAVKAAWQQNATSALTFTIPATGLRWSSTYVGHLNRVEYHDSRLPIVWTGVILEHQEREADVEITCLSAEWLYEGRLTEEWWQGVGTGGALVRALHDQAVRQRSLGIVPGALEGGGADYYVEYILKEVSDALTEIATLTGGDWWVEKVGHRHRDPWLLRWARGRGRDRRGQVVLAGEIVDRPDFKSSAVDVGTQLWAVGGGTGSELWQRIHFPLPDRAAIRARGLIERVYDAPDIIDPVLLREAGLRELARRRSLRQLPGVNLDNRRLTWGSFWVGDVVRLILAGVGPGRFGLDTSVIVRGIELDVDMARLGLVLEVV